MVSKLFHLISLATLLTLLTLSTEVRAHGGEDHGASPAEVTASGNQLSVATYPGSYEIFVRYAAPELNKPALLTVFISSWSTNHPMNASSITFDFPGNKNARVLTPITRIADGTYQTQVNFTKDDSYSALVNFKIGDDEEMAAISPIYAGTMALQHLAPSQVTAAQTASKGIQLWQILLLILLLLAGIAAIMKYKKRQLLTRTTTSVHTSTRTASQELKEKRYEK